MIYFDNSATTRPYIEAIDTYVKVSTEYFGNPSSLHPLGKISERLLNQSRVRAAELLEIDPSEIIFTSGGTEGNNLAIKGTAHKYQSRGRHLITSNIEHPSVFEAFQQLEIEGFKVTYLPVDENGHIKPEQVAAAITEETTLVSLIHVNNEMGSVQEIEEIGEILSSFPKVLFHVDHVQGIGKVSLNFKKAKIDLCTISAHKFHGMKGSGILYVKKGVHLHALLSGGRQERGIRAGTENVAGVASMIKALRITLDNFKSSIKEIEELNHWLEEECKKVPGVVINSPYERAPHILNISVPGLKPEVMVQALADKDIFVSTKSACSSKDPEPSRVLLNFGYDIERASSALRLSFSYDNTYEEAKEFIKIFPEIVASLKRVVTNK